MMRAYDESRFKCIYLTDRDIAAVFNAASVPRKTLSLPWFNRLPEGYEVVAVDREPTRRGWVLTLYHPSWPEVPEGARMPDAIPRGEYVMFHLTYGTQEGPCKAPND